MKEYYVIFNLNYILEALNCFRLHYDRFILIICSHYLIKTHCDYDIKVIRY